MTTEVSTTSTATITAAYQSPVLMRLEILGQSSPLTQCSRCPAALWMREGKGLSAYCRVMNVWTWSTSSPREIIDCDGPEMKQRR